MKTIKNDDMDKKKELIYLAALLHDIGKFYQRADAGSVRNSVYLKGCCREESSFCPCYNGIYTHKHVLWTAQFIEQYNAVFKNLVDYDSSATDTLVSLAAGHHLSKGQLSDLGKLIKEADCLSSGMDRESEDSFRDDQAESSWDQFKKTRMVSILQTVGVKKKEMDFSHLPVSETIFH